MIRRRQPYAPVAASPGGTVPDVLTARTRSTSVATARRWGRGAPNAALVTRMSDGRTRRRSLHSLHRHRVDRRPQPRQRPTHDPVDDIRRAAQPGYGRVRATSAPSSTSQWRTAHRCPAPPVTRAAMSVMPSPLLFLFLGCDVFPQDALKIPLYGGPGGHDDPVGGLEVSRIRTVYG